MNKKLIQIGFFLISSFGWLILFQWTHFILQFVFQKMTEKGSNWVNWWRSILLFITLLYIYIEWSLNKVFILFEFRCFRRSYCASTPFKIDYRNISRLSTIISHFFLQLKSFGSVPLHRFAVSLGYCRISWDGGWDGAPSYSQFFYIGATNVNIVKVMSHSMLIFHNDLVIFARRCQLKNYERVLLRWMYSTSRKIYLFSVCKEMCAFMSSDETKKSSGKNGENFLNCDYETSKLEQFWHSIALHSDAIFLSENSVNFFF